MARNLTTLIITLLLLGNISLMVARADDATDQRRVAQRFITAYFLQDMDTVRQCLPSTPANLFMKYPFAASPSLSQAKVDEKQALVEFTATMSDKKFPGKGGIVFYRNQGTWQVRQVMFYNKLPALFGLPTKSNTREDHAQEGTVMEIGKKFLAEWKANDVKGMMALWYDWTHRGNGRIKGLKVTNFTASNSETRWDDPYVPYSVKVSYGIGPIAYSMTPKGGVILVKEGNGWKVRANHFVFDF